VRRRARVTLAVNAGWQRCAPIEPISFIGLAAPAALLFQAGTKDELIPQEDARRYQQAANQPKEVR
jgi:hypothetical protein